MQEKGLYFREMENSTQNFVIALTGSLGSGKSTAAAVFEQLGATIVRSDELARVAVDPSTPRGRNNLKAIAEEFGQQALRPDGTLDRKAVGTIVFADPARRKTLEAILHPEIRALAAEAFANAHAAGAQLVVYDVPLFFEAGLNRGEFAAVVVVAADAPTSIARVIARDGLTEAQAKQRLATQLPIAEKIRLADYMIDNSKDLTHLRTQVEQVFAKLTAG